MRVVSAERDIVEGVPVCVVWEESESVDEIPTLVVWLRDEVEVMLVPDREVVAKDTVDDPVVWPSVAIDTVEED